MLGTDRYVGDSSQSPHQGDGIPHSGNIREEAMPIARPQSVHMAHGIWLHCLSWKYRSADDQHQGRLLDCGRCDIASPDGTWLFVPVESPNRSAGA